MAVHGCLRKSDGCRTTRSQGDSKDATPGFLDGPGCDLKEKARQVGGRAERLMRDLCDIGEGRIAQMGAAGVDMQILSLTAPGVEQLETAEAATLLRDTNDALAEAIARQPTRVSGFEWWAIFRPNRKLCLRRPPTRVAQDATFCAHHGNHHALRR
jgi:predicted TIM-barrel fold metal-dependent hydrolase